MNRECRRISISDTDPISIVRIGGAFAKGAGSPPDCVTPLGPAWLPDHALVFNYHSPRRGGGVLNVLPQPGAIVSGWLFRYNEEGLHALDVKEGVPHAYRREQVVVLDDAHEEHRVLTYRVIEENTEDFVTPATEYLAICRRARLGAGDRRGHSGRGRARAGRWRLSQRLRLWHLDEW